MTQVGDFLKPPTPRGAPGGPGPSGTGGDDRERDRLNYPKAPVAGFWRRLGALLFDLLLLYVVFRLAGRFLTDPLLALGRHSHPVAAGVVLAYFVLANGPVGRGRTVGKMLVGIRVLDAKGAPLSLGRSALRTLLLFPGIVAAFYVSPLVFDNDSYHGMIYGLMLSGYLTFALFVGTAVAMIFNPFKQGLHDFIMRTTVQPAAAEPMPFEGVAEVVGGQWRRFHKQAMINGTATFALILALLAVLTVQQMKEGDAGRLYETERSLVSESFDKDVLVAMRVYPMGVDPDNPAETFTPQIAQDFYTALYDQESSETMRVVLAVQRRGKWKENPEEPPLRTKLEDFAATYRERVFGGLPGDAIYPPHRETGEAVQLTRRPLVFDIRVEEILYLFFASPMHVGRAGNVEIQFPPLEEPVAAPKEPAAPPED